MNRPPCSMYRSWELQDRMDPREIEKVVDRVLQGAYGWGSERKNLLGDWYNIIQGLVNIRLEYPYEKKEFLDRIIHGDD